MTKSEAKNKGYTHLCKMYGFKCYASFTDDGGCEVRGTNLFREKMINIFVWIECNFPINEGFPVEILEEL